MRVNVNSMWDTNRRRPNVYFYIESENETERALLRSLYSVKPKVVSTTDGEILLDFYPEGVNRG